MNKNLLKLRVLALAYMIVAVFMAITATSALISILAYVAFLGSIYFLTLSWIEKA